MQREAWKFTDFQANKWCVPTIKIRVKIFTLQQLNHTLKMHTNLFICDVQGWVPKEKVLSIAQYCHFINSVCLEKGRGKNPTSLK